MNQTATALAQSKTLINCGRNRELAAPLIARLLESSTPGERWAIKRHDSLDCLMIAYDGERPVNRRHFRYVDGLITGRCGIQVGQIGVSK